MFKLTYKQIFLILFLLISAALFARPTKAEAANRYWVGGTATWDSTAGTKWAEYSGGSGGASLPTATDDVFFDASSGAVTVTASSLSTGRSLNFTGYIGTFSVPATAIIQLSGSLTLSSGMTYSGTTGSTIIFRGASAGNTITSAGKTLNAHLTFSGTGAYKFSDTLAAGTSAVVTLNKGSLDFNSQAASMLSFSSTTTETRTLSMGSSTITFSSSASSGWTVNSSNLTFDAGTSSLILGPTLGGSLTTTGTLTYYDVSCTITGNRGCGISGTNTFRNLTIVSNSQLGTVTFSGNQTITGTLNISSTTRARVVGSSTPTITAAAVSLTNVDFEKITAAGAASPFTGSSLGNCTGNTNISVTPVTRYWVGNGGSWNDTTHWSTSSGGSSGASVPLCHDTAILDANSITIGSQTVTINNLRLPGIDFTNVANNPTLAATTGTTYRVSGSFITKAGMSYSGTSVTIAMIGDNNASLASPSMTYSLTIDKPGYTVTAQGSVNTGTFTLTSGSFVSNNQTISTGSFVSSGTLTRSITLGSSTVTMSCPTITGSNLTLDAGTSSITSSCGGTAELGGFTYNDFTFSSTGNVSVSGANTFANFTRTGTAASVDGVTFTSNQIISGTLTLTGNSLVNRLAVVGNPSATLTAGIVSITNVDFVGITAAGGASPFTGTSVANCGGNTNITSDSPVTRYWVGNGGNWNDTARWSISTGGSSGASVPLCHDTVVFDANSITSSSQTITGNVQSYPSIDFTNVANNPTFSTTTSSRALYGSFTLKSGMTFANGITLSGRGSTSLTTGGATITSTITINTLTGTVTLQDALTSSSSMTVNTGTFNANNNDVSINSVTINSGSTLTMGSGTWTLTSSTSPFSNSGTVNAGTSTVKITNTGSTNKTIAGGGATFYNLWITGAGTGNYIVTGSNTFNDIKNDTAPHTINFTAGTTNTVSSFTTSSTAVLTLSSTSPGSAWNISKSSGSVFGDYIIIQDSNVAGGNFYAGLNSVNGGGNTGWVFTGWDGETYANSWWNTSWTARRKISFDNHASAENLTNFPVLVSLTSNTIDYSKTQNLGQDIRFVDSDQTTVLAHEIEKWDESGTSYVWVRVPQIDAGSVRDYVWVYYNNNGASDGQDAKGVWDENYEGVWHLPNGSSLSSNDSSINASNGTNAGYDAASGQIDGGASSDGTLNDKITVGAISAMTGAAKATLSGWVYRSNTGHAMTFGADASGSGGGNRFSIQRYSDGTIYAAAENSGSAYTYFANTDTGWHHITLVYDGSLSGNSNRAKIYYDGALASTSYAGSIPATLGTAETFYLGYGATVATNTGSIDEVRLSVGAARSADWVEAEYLTSMGRMNSYSNEEVYDAALYLVVSPSSEATNSAWWNNSWTARRKIVINNSSSTENLFNFPLLVTLSSANIDYSKTQNAGQDLRFVDSDQSTALSYEIEKWDEAGTSLAWVKVPQINLGSTRDHIWMYYGNNGASDGQSATSVWDGNYKAVWHLKDGSSLTLSDSTSNAYTLTDHGDLATSGKIDGGVLQNASNNYLSTSSPVNGMTSLTYSGWINWNGAQPGGYAGVVSGLNGDTNPFNRVMIEGATSKILLQDASANNTYSTSTLSTDTWYHIAVAVSGNVPKIYINGSLDKTGTAGNWSSSSGNLNLGTGVGPGYYFGGKQDELRISSVERSAEWLEAEYKSGNNQLISFEDEQTPTAPAAKGGGSNGGSPTPVGGTGSGGGVSVNGSWWNASWTARRMISIENASSSTNLTDFPLLVSLTSSNIDYSKTQNSGQDIRFVDSDQTTSLAYEIEKWDEAGTSIVWVKVPQINASTNTDHIWMYYGNNGASDGQAATSVWDSNFKAVWHLPNGSSLTTNDSTSNTHHLTNNSATAGTGQVDGAATLNGSTQYLSSVDHADYKWGNLRTISLWFNLANTSQTLPRLINQWSGTDGWVIGWIGSPANGDANTMFINAGVDALAPNSYTGYVKIDNDSVANASQWYKLDVVTNGTTISAVYLNGTSRTMSIGTGLISGSTTSLDIGRRTDNARYFAGSMDEIRFSSATRSADWLSAEYRTMTNAMNTFTAETTSGADQGGGGGSASP